MEGYGGIWSRIWWCGYGAPILDGKQALSQGLMDRNQGYSKYSTAIKIARDSCYSRLRNDASDGDGDDGDSGN
jgi:hypothetical protein